MKLRTAGLASVKSATFGMVRKNPNGTLRAHQGVDLAVDNGYRIYAVEDAEVVTVSKAYNGYGWTITLQIKKDGQTLYPFYAHLSRIDVKVGDKVKAGTILGLTGSTGNAAGMKQVAQGAHLHFEVRTTRQPGLGLVGRLDPLTFITLD